ncbi:hypothetical protein DCCM_4551 [Desulfocucumis palustris]|uniref:Uncharacterized protein n=1 Tax=Desulfocucumis palustris TaxID=1898651 RepID=A0A2L2XHG0_9FIRM|nr:hypothetical protein DCCM_4551 [Desulfocucumis palustris]
MTSRTIGGGMRRKYRQKSFRNNLILKNMIIMTIWTGLSLDSP